MMMGGQALKALDRCELSVDVDFLTNSSKHGRRPKSSLAVHLYNFELWWTAAAFKAFIVWRR